MEVGDTVEFAVVCSDRRQTVKAGTKVTKKLRTGVGNSDKGRMFPYKYYSQRYILAKLFSRGNTLIKLVNGIVVALKRY